MDSPASFYPPKRNGSLFQGSLIIVLSALTAWLIWQASNTEEITAFIFYLVPALLSFSLVPWIAYRLQSLLVAEYRLERDGIRLHWGLRHEDIPMNQIIWVKRAYEMESQPPLPRLRWPGSILGERKMPSGTPLEYMAAGTDDLVFLATHVRIFALSPEDVPAFLERYQRLSELGSLSPFGPHSQYPSFLLARVWRVRPARGLILSGLIANLVLLIWVGLAIPNHDRILLGFVVGGEPVPAIRLILLPLVSSFFYLVDLLAGLYFFRRVGLPDREAQNREAVEEQNRQHETPAPVFAYLLWSSGLITPLMFNLAVYYILRNA